MILKDKAIDIIHKKVPGFKIIKIVTTNKYYIFYMAPIGSNNQKDIFNDYLDCAFKIDKRNGKFEGYNPLIDD